LWVVTNKRPHWEFGEDWELTGKDIFAVGEQRSSSFPPFVCRVLFGKSSYRPSYKNPEKWPKNLSGISPKMF